MGRTFETESSRGCRRLRGFAGGLLPSAAVVVPTLLAQALVVSSSANRSRVLLVAMVVACLLLGLVHASSVMGRRAVPAEDLARLQAAIRHRPDARAALADPAVQARLDRDA